MKVTEMHRNAPRHASLPILSPPSAGVEVGQEASKNMSNALFNEEVVGNCLIQVQPLVAVVETDQLPEPAKVLHTIEGPCVESGYQLEIATSSEAIRGFFSGCRRTSNIIVVRAKKPRPTADLQREISAMHKNSKGLQTRRKGSIALEFTDVGTDLDQLERLQIELADAHRQVTRQHAQLQKVNAEKSQILGVAAHELRNPISGILNASEYLLADAARLLEHNDMTLLEAIRSSCRFMLQLINNMLDISAIESGKLRLDRKPTDILLLIEQNLSLNRPLADRRQIGISVIARGPLPLLNIDSQKIYQVIDNLVTNAIKFSVSGTKIEILVQAEEEFATIAVRDQGPGIPANERKAVFKLFRTARGKDASRAAGTGLGLAIAKRIAEAHGGRLLLDSQVGKGSTFTVRLPVSGHDHAAMPNRKGRASRSVRNVVASAVG